MMKTFAFTLDLEKPDSLATKISISVADLNVIQFMISLTQDGAPFDLTGRTVYLVTKLGAACLKTLCTVEDAVGGVVSVILPTDATNKVGLFTGELEVLEGLDQRAIPNQFTYAVRTSFWCEPNPPEAQNEIQP